MQVLIFIVVTIEKPFSIFLSTSIRQTRGLELKSRAEKARGHIIYTLNSENVEDIYVLFHVIVLCNICIDQEN